MSDLETRFQKLIGKTPDAAQVAELVRVRDALGLRPDDDLWLILFALSHYQGLYKKIPEEIDRSLARAEVMLERFDATRLPEGWFFRKIEKIGAFRLVAGVTTLLLLCLLTGAGAGYFLGMPDDMQQRVLSCEQGKIEIRNSERWCYPVNRNNEIIGFRLKH